MSCRRAYAIDLAEFLVDPRAEASAGFREHYPTCAACAAEVRAWTELEAKLRGAELIGHPSAADLLRLEDAPGELSAGERRALEAHLAACATCADELASLRGFRPAALGLPARSPATARIRVPLRERVLGPLGRLVLHPAFAYALVLLLLVPTVWNLLPESLALRSVPAPEAPRSDAPGRASTAAERTRAEAEAPKAREYPREAGKDAPATGAEAPESGADVAQVRAEAQESAKEAPIAGARAPEPGPEAPTAGTETLATGVLTPASAGSPKAESFEDREAIGGPTEAKRVMGQEAPPPTLLGEEERTRLQAEPRTAPAPLARAGEARPLARPALRAEEPPVSPAPAGQLRPAPEPPPPSPRLNRTGVVTTREANTAERDAIETTKAADTLQRASSAELRLGTFEAVSFDAERSLLVVTLPRDIEPGDHIELRIRGAEETREIREEAVAEAGVTRLELAVPRAWLGAGVWAVERRVRRPGTSIERTERFLVRVP